MKKRHKSLENTGDNRKSEDGQRELLCHNKASNRRSISDFTNKTLSDEQIRALVDLALIYKGIHIRLLMEGYTIEGGRIYKK